MNRRDEAVEAGLREYVKPRMHTNESLGKLRADLSAFLEAALAVLQPTVPNKVEALDALPVGTVLRGEDHEGTPWLVSLTPAFDSAQSVPYWRDMGIDSWQVLWTPEVD